VARRKKRGIDFAKWTGNAGRAACNRFIY